MVNRVFSFQKSTLLPSPSVLQSQSQKIPLLEPPPQMANNLMDLLNNTDRSPVHSSLAASSMPPPSFNSPPANSGQSRQPLKRSPSGNCFICKQHLSLYLILLTGSRQALILWQNGVRVVANGTTLRPSTWRCPTKILKMRTCSTSNTIHMAKKVNIWSSFCFTFYLSLPINLCL